MTGNLVYSRLMAELQPKSQAEAREFIESSEFIWHQRFELVPGVETPGTHPIDVLFDLGGGPRDLRGMSVLDIGTSNGGAAFLMERWGASRVVAVDIYAPDWFGFDRLRAFLGSSVEYLQGTVYDLNRLLGGETFDYVLFWGVLYHLRHPLLALDQVRSVVAADGAVDVETAVSDDEVASSGDLPVARFYRRDELAGDASNWFSPTVACLEDWCVSSGLQPTAVQVWGEGDGKRCLAVCRPIEPEYAKVSYEVPLRVEPVRETGP
jgi:tRNA (mo5U34)-methyltransferase